MALTGTINGTTANDRIIAKIQWSAVQNIEENCSTITATLTYSRTNTGYTTGGNWSGSLSIGDKTKKVTGKYIEITKGSNTEAITYTETVEHNADGTLSVRISASGKISNSSLTSTTIGETVTLDAISRPSSIINAAEVTLGNACDVRWIPNSITFWFKLRFYLGEELLHTTEAIHPNITSAFAYTDYTVPLSVAERLTDRSSDIMTVELITYLDEGCVTEIGKDRESFTVTVPNDENTQPTVNMELTAVNGLNGLYLQGQSKVQAKISADGKLGAGIRDESYSITVAGVSSRGPYLSDTLTQVGEIEVTGGAVDTRGIPGSVTQNITVQPYYIPRLTGVAAYRCDSNGKAADNGEYLKIEATRDYAPVTVNGEQHNFCKIQYQYKSEDAEKFPDPEEILSADSEGDSIVTKPLLNATFSKAQAYMVQITVVDTVGRSQTVTVAIPSERVFRHKRAGGKGLGLGGMCEEDDLLDVHWNQRVRKDLQVDGSVCGVYIRVAERSANPEIKTVKLRSLTEQAGNAYTQSIVAFGEGFNIVWTLISAGNAWHAVDGSGETVSVTPGEGEIEEGILTIQLPTNRETPIMMMSADPFEIIE